MGEMAVRAKLVIVLLCKVTGDVACCLWMNVPLITSLLRQYTKKLAAVGVKLRVIYLMERGESNEPH
jgi:hypothetical protein